MPQFRMSAKLVCVRAACLVAGIWTICASAHPLANAQLSRPQVADLEVPGITTVYAYITHTETINPAEVTVTHYAYTLPTWLTTVNTTVTAGCTQYSYPDMKLGRAEPTTTTVTADTTVTVTRTDVPACTHSDYEAVTYITYTTPYTYTSTHCSNTLVAYYEASTTITSTSIKYGTFTRTTITEVCLTTMFPPTEYTPTTGSVYTPPPDPFLSTTLVTTTLYTTNLIMVTASTDTLTVSTIECNNPTIYLTQTYFTRTITPISTVTLPATTCSTTTTIDACAKPAKARAVAGRNSDREVEDYVVQRQEATATTPITTPIVTEVTFTDILMVGATVTATTTDTWTTSVCPLPTSS